MPTAFISYSWETDEHRAWVLRLAEDLRDRNVEVWLDQWDIQLGDDVTRYMERAVSQADCVLLVCTDVFGRKANERRGGVGNEQAIVTAEILNTQPRRGRFVCLLRQGTPSQALPLYMQSRLFLDCRDDTQYGQALVQIAGHVLREQAAGAVPAVLPESAQPAAEASLHREPDRWVLVAGTGAQRGFSDELKALSTALGRSLLQAGCGLVTGGWPGVDEWVARSFAGAAQEHTVALEDALVQVLVKGDAPPFPAGQLFFVDKGRQEWDEPIRRAGAVLLLGGLGGTMETGRLALQMGKRVLPIADTGGDARKMYLEMLQDWPRHEAMGITLKEFQRLGRPASAAVEAAIALVRQLPATAI